MTTAPHTLLITEIDADVEEAYDAAASIKKQKALLSRLLYVRSKLKPPNAQIADVDSALSMLQARLDRHKTLTDWLLKPTIAELVKNGVVAAVAFTIGLYFPALKSKFEDVTKPAATAASPAPVPVTVTAPTAKAPAAAASKQSTR